MTDAHDPESGLLQPEVNAGELAPPATGAWRLSLWEWLLLFTAVLWSVTAIGFAGAGWPDRIPLRLLLWTLALGPALALTVAGQTRWRWLALLSSLVVGGGFLSTIEASHTRNWSEDQNRIARVERRGDAFVFRNIRDFDYQSESRWRPSWVSMTLRPEDLRGAAFVVEHFGGPEAIAHTLVSFEFTGERFLVVSVEIRKEQGESYDPIAGIFRRYELAYVLATERDALKLRTHHRKSRVYLHPIQVGPERLQAYFADVVARIEGLSKQPEFYNTLSSSCTTNLARHFAAVSGQSLAWDYRIYLPGYSGALLHDLGLAQPAESVEAMLQRDRVDIDRVDQHPGPYSRALRARSAVAP